MSSKKLVLAILVALVAPLVRAGGPTPPPTLTPTTLQVYDSKGKLVGAPLPFVNNCTDLNYDFFGSCSYEIEYLGLPTMNTALSVAMKYSGGGSFTLNIGSIPLGPTLPSWIPDVLFYVLPNCTSQAYMDSGNFFISPFTMTSRLGVVGGGVTGGNPVYVSATNPVRVDITYHSSSLEYEGCSNVTGQIENAVAVSPTNISLDAIWSPPFHIQ
jgi:hypothetical protein